eukprot:Sspe_Gene.39513::Locus_19064_Transcript_1_1_Confidence_1.000_Length_978::g.39513::m.39513
MLARTALLLVVAGVAAGCMLDIVADLKARQCYDTSLSCNSDECIMLAQQLLEDANRNETDVSCGMLSICNTEIGKSCTKCHSLVSTYNTLYLNWPNVGEPVYDINTHECPVAASATRICVTKDAPVYFETTIHKVSGFEYEITSEDGSPLGLVELFNINDLENDEVMDCFVKDSVDTSSCYNSRISRGVNLPPSIVFDPAIKVRFGFKACPNWEGNPPCAKLRFLTPTMQTTTNLETHGCTTSLQKATELTPMCTL